LLLGLLRVDEATALNVLEGLGVKADEIIEAVEQSIGDSNRDDVASEDVPFGEESKKSLELALAEARLLDSIYVGTEHLLLALLRQEDTEACQILHSVGVRMEGARAATKRVWESGEDESGTGDNYADQAMAKVLRESLETSDQTLVDFVREMGAAETADWARFPDGSWKTWEDIDWDSDAEEIWRVLREWQERQES
jgi:ATP-dependent Clp protease ATP-binding subunit ClpC